jgi:hypothetical protein
LIRFNELLDKLVFEYKIYFLNPSFLLFDDESSNPLEFYKSIRTQTNFQQATANKVPHRTATLAFWMLGATGQTYLTPPVIDYGPHSTPPRFPSCTVQWYLKSKAAQQVRQDAISSGSPPPDAGGPEEEAAMAGKHGRNGFDDDNVNPFAVSVPSVIRTILSVVPSAAFDLSRSRGELARFSDPITVVCSRNWDPSLCGCSCSGSERPKDTKRRDADLCVWSLVITCAVKVLLEHSWEGLLNYRSVLLCVPMSGIRMRGSALSWPSCWELGTWIQCH